MAEQISLAEVKAHLDIDSDYTGDDVKLERLIPTVRESMESYLGLSLVPKALQVITNTYVTELRYGPVGQIVSVADADGNEVEYTTEGILHPTVSTYTYPVTITYDAGYAEGELPDQLKTAMLLWIQGLYDNQADLIKSAKDMAFPHSRNLAI